MEQDVAIPEKVATALLYGIETEVTGYPREASAGRRRRRCIYLYPLADKDLIAQIRNARLPHSHFECLLQALQSSFIYDRLIISWVDDLPQPEQAAEVVDFMIRFEKVDWAVCGGVFEDKLILSVRAWSRTPAPARCCGRWSASLARRRARPPGRRLHPLAEHRPHRDRGDPSPKLRRRFLKALKIEDVRGQRLVPLREMLQNLQS